MTYVNIYSLIINRGLAQIKFTESKPDKILKSKLFYTIVEQVNLKQLVLGYVHVYSGIHDRQFKNGGIHVHICMPVRVFDEPKFKLTTVKAELPCRV